MATSELDQVIGRQVKAARKMLWPTQEDLARRLTERGVPTHQTTIARLERGERSLTVEDIFAVAATLSISPLHLLAGTYTNESVPVLPTLPPQPPSRMIAWLRGDYALAGTDTENFATVLPSGELYAHLQSGVHNLKQSMNEYLEAVKAKDDVGKVVALRDIRNEIDRQFADLERADRSVNTEKESTNG
jgi:transcriptional regulator with XRE-family HTH domain